MRKEKEIPLNDKNNKVPPIFNCVKAEAGLQEGTIAQFFIFQGEDCLGWDCFNNKKVSIGRGDGADLTLNGQNILDIHANVFLKDHQIIVSAENPEHKVLVNGKDVDTCILGPFDYLTIGPYTLKVKLKSIISKASDIEVSTQENHPSDTHPIKADMDTDQEDIKGGKEKIIENFGDPEDINVKEKTGSELENIKAPVPVTEGFIEKTKSHSDCFENESETFHQDIVNEPEEFQTQNTVAEISEIAEFCDEEDEEEDDEYDIEGLFSLKEEFIDAERTEVHQGKENIVVKVVKFRKNNVIDVCFLHRKEKYYWRDGHKRFYLAVHKDSEKCYFFFNDQYNGQVSINDNRTIDLTKLCVPENIYRKRGKIYRHLLPKNGSVFINDGYYEYLLRMVTQGKSPHIAESVKSESVKKENYFYKNLIKSSVFHFFIFLMGGLFISLRIPLLSPPAPDEPRFVQIDTRQIADNFKKIQKMQIKEPEANKQKEQQLKKQQITASVRKKVLFNKKSQGKRKISRSPNAGGGSGKAGGNVLNRNIKQAGILGVIGMKDGVGIGAQEVLASVTNLDAVSSSYNSEGGFKVAGIVGKVGDSKIEVPTVGLVNTKGSAQVFRSAGVEGKGEVAALEIGETGKNQVMAMVKADLSQKVHIQGGGMSRDAVKKVIDQHLDEITYCYETALISDPSIMGKIVFEWKILIAGKVGEVKINFSSIQSTEIHSCIKEKIKSWQFPKPHGREVIVSYPFIFDIVGF